MHCPECVREARGSMAANARPIGRRFANAVRPGSGRPVVTYAIIGLNVIVFILELLTGNSILGNGSGSVADALAYFPGAIAVSPWVLLSNAFVHANLIHIALNMFMLFIIGIPLERHFGRVRMIAFYLIGILGADVAVDFLSRGGAIGASGAIFALLGVLILFSRRIGFNPSWLITIGVVNLGYGFVGAGISWQGHLGGLVAGLLIGALLLYTGAARRRTLRLTGLIALPAIFVLALVAHAFF